MSVFTFDNFVLSQVKCNDAKDTANLFVKEQEIGNGGSHRKDLGSLSFAIDNMERLLGGGTW